MEATRNNIRIGGMCGFVNHYANIVERRVFPIPWDGVAVDADLITFNTHTARRLHQNCSSTLLCSTERAPLRMRVWYVRSFE